MGALANAAPVPQSLRLFLTITHPAPKKTYTRNTMTFYQKAQQERGLYVESH